MGVFKRVARSKAVYVARKGLRKAGQAIKGRYYNKRTGVRLNNVVKDVMMIKKLVNVEKKRLTLAYSNNVGQYANLLNSYNILDVTPVPSQGDGYNARNGASIKCVSFHMDVQMIHQGSTTQPVNGKMMLILNKGQPCYTGADLQTFYGNMLVANPFVQGYAGVSGATGIYDLNSSMNPDFYGRFKIIQTTRFRIQPDQISGQAIYKTIKIGKKYQHHIRFDKNSNTVLNGQLLLITLLDSGNAGGVTSTLTGVPVTQSSTGLTQNINLVHYYVDN